MATVSVKMYATVREAAGTPSIQLEADDIDDLFKKLGKSLGPKFSRLLRDAESSPESLVVLLNGRNLTSPRTACPRLADGDEIALFPPVSGG